MGFFFMSVPQEGVEPPRLIRAQVPKTCVYANFTTAASLYVELYQEVRLFS